VSVDIVWDLQIQGQGREQGALVICKVPFLGVYPLSLYNHSINITDSINLDSNVSLNEVSWEQVVDHLLLACHVEGSLEEDHLPVEHNTLILVDLGVPDLTELSFYGDIDKVVEAAVLVDKIIAQLKIRKAQVKALS